MLVLYEIQYGNSSEKLLSLTVITIYTAASKRLKVTSQALIPCPITKARRTLAEAHSIVEKDLSFSCFFQLNLLNSKSETGDFSFCNQ